MVIGADQLVVTFSNDPGISREQAKPVVKTIDRLNTAIRSGNHDAVKKIINKGVPLVDDSLFYFAEKSPLLVAIAEGDKAMIETLGAEIKRQNALIDGKHGELLKMLGISGEMGYNPYAAISQGVFRAALYGDTQTLKDATVYSNFEKKKNSSPIRFPKHKEHYSEVFSALLDAGLVQLNNPDLYHKFGPDRQAYPDSMLSAVNKAHQTKKIDDATHRILSNMLIANGGQVIDLEADTLAKVAAMRKEAGLEEGNYLEVCGFFPESQRAKDGRSFLAMESNAKNPAGKGSKAVEVKVNNKALKALTPADIVPVIAAPATAAEMSPDSAPQPVAASVPPVSPPGDWKGDASKLKILRIYVGYPDAGTLQKPEIQALFKKQDEYTAQRFNPELYDFARWIPNSNPYALRKSEAGFADVVSGIEETKVQLKQQGITADILVFEVNPAAVRSNHFGRATSNGTLVTVGPDPSGTLPPLKLITDEHELNHAVSMLPTSDGAYIMDAYATKQPIERLQQGLHSELTMHTNWQDWAKVTTSPTIKKALEELKPALKATGYGCTTQTQAARLHTPSPGPDMMDDGFPRLEKGDGFPSLYNHNNRVGSESLDLLIREVSIISKKMPIGLTTDEQDTYLAERLSETARQKFLEIKSGKTQPYQLVNPSAESLNTSPFTERLRDLKAGFYLAEQGRRLAPGGLNMKPASLNDVENHGVADSAQAPRILPDGKSPSR
jgi:hypothetical protein